LYHGDVGNGTRDTKCTLEKEGESGRGCMARDKPCMFGETAFLGGICKNITRHRDLNRRTDVVTFVVTAMVTRRMSRVHSRTVTRHGSGGLHKTPDPFRNDERAMEGLTEAERQPGGAGILIKVGAPGMKEKEGD